MHWRARDRLDLSAFGDGHRAAVHAVAAQRQISGIDRRCDPDHIGRIAAKQIRRTTQPHLVLGGMRVAPHRAYRQIVRSRFHLNATARRCA